MVAGLLVTSAGANRPLTWAEVTPTEAKQKIDQIRTDAKQKKMDIAKVEAEINEHKKVIDALDKKTIQLDNELAKLRKQHGENQQQLKRVEDKVMHKLVTLYLKGEDAHLAKLVMADSFSDFLRRYELIRIIVKQDLEDFNEFADST
ncbi:hypothetical protein [Laceyella putida]|uniref:Peptidase M23 n=1 Tax=Laceyella putida TaxID=110101 RepID=A0ABW2RKW6_9BACL